MIILVGPGLDDGTRCRKLASLLDTENRVVRVHRRQYQSDQLCTVADEVEDVLGLTHEPAVIYGHSSGAVVALEALVAAPEKYTGAVIYEPAAVTDLPLGTSEVLARARKTSPGKAMAIFTHEVVGLPAWKARLVGGMVALAPAYRRLVPRQLNDLEALRRLGNRLTAYADIKVPTIMLSGDRSPRHLIDRVDAIHRILPNSRRVVLAGQEHGADLKAPAKVAELIRNLL